jgi:membrane protein
VITLGSLGARRRELVDRVRGLVHRFEPVSRVVNHVNSLEAFDVSLILAAQAFLTIVPLLIVLAAFTPRLLGVPMSNELQASLGLSNSSLAFRDMLGGPGHAARVGGVVGFVLVISAGLSTANALQRSYERVWSLCRLGLLRSAWRSTAWLAACVLSFGLSGLAASAVKSLPYSNELLLLIALAGAFLFWWWTPHLLLAGRIGWRALLPSAVTTGGVLVALLWISPLLMPGFVTSSEYEFGPLGTVFVVMLWLTIVCSIVVFCAIAGQVIATGPRLSRQLHLTPQRGRGSDRRQDGPANEATGTTGTIEPIGAARAVAAENNGDGRRLEAIDATGPAATAGRPAPTAAAPPPQAADVDAPHGAPGG